MARTRSCLALCAALVLIACGGGGGDAAAPGGGTTTTPPIGGINGGGIARGTITGIGSIFVNGVEFSTSTAAITIEGGSGSESALRIGQVVVVQGTISDDARTGTARTVSYNDNVEGPITSVNATANTCGCSARRRASPARPPSTAASARRASSASRAATSSRSAACQIPPA